MRGDTADATTQVVACPQCSAQFMFSRSPSSRIDECGFESYRFECKGCAATLAGIIDPADDTLLISQTVT